MKRITTSATQIALVLSLCAIATVAAAADAYPSRPIRIVTAAAGGGNDFTARIIAQGLANSLGQRVIVDNAAGRTFRSSRWQKATPDGYTILLQNNTVWVAPLLERSATIISRSSPDLAHRPRAEHPRGASIAAGQLGEGAHRRRQGRARRDQLRLGRGRLVEFHRRRGVQGDGRGEPGAHRLQGHGPGAERCPRRTGEADIRDHDFRMGPRQVRQLKALAITSAEPSALAPGLPTVAASGVPGYKSEAIYGSWAPARTPQPILAPAPGDRESAGDAAEPRAPVQFGRRSRGQPPQVLAAEIKSETERLAQVFKRAAIRAE